MHLTKEGQGIRKTNDNMGYNAPIDHINHGFSEPRKDISMPKDKSLYANSSLAMRPIFLKVNVTFIFFI